jgi:hypothetical protein
MLLWHLWLFATVGCGNRGVVTFTIDPPANQPLNPIGPRVTQFSITRPDGSVLAAVAPGSQQQIPLGPLQQQTMKIDLTFSATSGTQLVGEARLKDVVFENGMVHDYPVEVRKPLLTIGAALADEAGPGSLEMPGQIIDPNTGEDLTHPKMADPSLAPPKLPQGTTAATATWDGRFLLAGASKGLSVIDTGSGATVGTAPIAFTPAGVAVGARDSAVAVLDPAGNLAIFADVGALTSSPGSQNPTVINLPPGTTPRAVTFSADGQRIYVLTGGTKADPCNDTTAPMPNTIAIAGLDGTKLGLWQLPSFASDFAVDAQSGRVLVSMSVDNKVGWIDSAQAYGAVTPAPLVAATCPTALRVANGAAFVVTSGRPMGAMATSTDFVLMRVPVMSNGSDSEPLQFSGPVFYTSQIDMLPNDMNTDLVIKLRPRGITAYGMAVSPDGGHAVFATRARYRESMSDTFTLFQGTCKPQGIDIVEYGLYQFDTASGTSSYTSRSQNVVSPTATPPMVPNCAICMVPLGISNLEIDLVCQSAPGDRAAGLGAVFGGT